MFQQPQPPAIATPNSVRLLLVSDTDATGAPQFVDLSCGDVTFGRQKDCSVPLRGVGISSVHCRFYRQLGGTTYSTYLEDRRFCVFEFRALKQAQFERYILEQ